MHIHTWRRWKRTFSFDVCHFSLILLTFTQSERILKVHQYKWSRIIFIGGSGGARDTPRSNHFHLGPPPWLGPSVKTWNPPLNFCLLRSLSRFTCFQPLTVTLRAKRPTILKPKKRIQDFIQGGGGANPKGDKGEGGTSKGHM